jgi:transcription termination factor NusB
VISRRQARRQALFLLYQWDLSGAEIGAQYDGEVGWTADRLGVVERSALRVAIHELDRGEVPDEVAINEAVAFAKRYSSEDAGRLVNGILGRIQREEALRR